MLLALVDLALETGMAVRVLLPDDTPDGWLSGQLRARAVEVRKGPLAPARRRYLGPRQLPGYGLALIRAVRFLLSEAARCNPEVIHVNTSTVIAAASLGRREGRRLVWHVHEIQSRPRAVAWALRVLPLLAADDIIAVSDAVRRSLRSGRFQRANIYRIYDAMPPRPCAAPAMLDERTTRCVFAGRISERKGYDLFVDAAADIAPSFPSVQFLLAGVPAPGEEWRMEALHRQIAQRGISDRTEVLGMRDDLATLFDAADVAVFPSRLPEGFGLAMAEAMRSGCAVISTNHGAASEIVTDGVSGLLVAPCDRRALAEALQRLLADTPLRERLAEVGRDHVIRAFSDAAFAISVRAVWEGHGG
ncbi:MAG: glycosyltransferase family 4 protein [Actinomycetota bacterium]|nr:glycosyltransferase family 4 protein [Actinomycetota bacterium]